MLKGIFAEKKIYENAFVSTAEQDTRIIAAALDVAVGQKWRSPAFEANIANALDGKAWAGEPTKSPSTGLPVVLHTAPIMDGDRVIGILGLPLDLGTFAQRIVTQITIGKTGFPVITNRSGLVVAHPNKDYIFKLDTSTMDWGKKILASPSGIGALLHSKRRGQGPDLHQGRDLRPDRHGFPFHRRTSSIAP